MTEHNTDIPSGRIRFALEAMREFEQMPGCEIHMSMWRGLARETGISVSYTHLTLPTKA